MCGRYNITDNPHVHELLHQLGIDIGPLPTRYNIAPTEQAITLTGGDQPLLLEMRWWLTPSWSDGPSTKFTMFNARAETIATNRAYHGAFKYRRGIVPASSFIEWRKNKGEKQPYLITNKEECLFLAAVWELWNNELYSCSIVTTGPCDAFQPLHTRQPLILDRQQAIRWLNAEWPKDKRELGELMMPARLDELLLAPIDASIGNSRNKTAPVLIAEPVPLSEFR